MESVCDRVPIITTQTATNTSNDRTERERSNGDILYDKARELNCSTNPFSNHISHWKGIYFTVNNQKVEHKVPRGCLSGRITGRCGEGFIVLIRRHPFHNFNKKLYFTLNTSL